LCSRRSLAWGEGAERLEPCTHPIVQFSHLRSRPLRKHGLALTQVSSVSKRLLAHEKLVEDKTSCKHIGGWTRRLWTLMAFRSKVMRIKLVDNLLRNGMATFNPGTREVKACQAHPAVTPDENRHRIECSMYNLMGVRMRQRREYTTRNAELLVKGQRQIWTGQ